MEATPVKERVVVLDPLTVHFRLREALIASGKDPLQALSLIFEFPPHLHHFARISIRSHVAGIPAYNYPSFNGALLRAAEDPNTLRETFDCYSAMYNAALQAQTPNSLAEADAIYHQINPWDPMHFFSLN